MVKVSVITPTYNCAAYVGEAVESVLAQTYRDFELIVIDDGSTDRTPQVLQPYDDQIIYLRQENQGESVARNRGIRLAKGEYVAFLDSDDLWLPNTLALQVAALDKVPDAVLSYGYSYVINADGQRLRHHGKAQKGRGTPGLHPLFERLVISNIIGNPNVVVVRRRYLVEDGILFDPNIRWGEDWDLWLRLALRGPFYFIPEPLACYRIRKPKRRLRIEASPVFIEQNVAILDKVFTQLTAAQAAAYREVQVRAYEALYLRSAIYNFELGNVAEGRAYLQQVAQVNPTVVENGRAFSRRVADEGFRISTEQEDFSAGLAFMDRVFTHLPESLHVLRHYQAQALADLHMAAAFTAFEQRRRGATLKHVTAALGAYPPCAGNLGLLSIGVRSALPWGGS